MLLEIGCGLMFFIYTTEPNSLSMTGKYAIAYHTGNQIAASKYCTCVYRFDIATGKYNEFMVKSTTYRLLHTKQPLPMLVRIIKDILPIFLLICPRPTMVYLPIIDQEIGSVVHS